MIYCVEDDDNIRELVIYTLETTGLKAKGFAEGAEFMEALAFDTPELILLDIMLPGEDGLAILRKLKSSSKTKDIPVIMVTAKGTEYDKVIGLDSGADDYITKPFAIEELLARIRAALRKRPAQAAEPPRSLLTAGPLTMDTDRHEVSVNGEGVELTRREFDLLRYLLENKERVISRESLLDHVWGFDFVGETNAVDVYIRFLRAKIDEHFGIKLIHTVRGVGYVIREEGQ